MDIGQECPWCAVVFRSKLRNGTHITKQFCSEFCHFKAAQWLVKEKFLLKNSWFLRGYDMRLGVLITCSYQDTDKLIAAIDALTSEYGGNVVFAMKSFSEIRLIER